MRIGRILILVAAVAIVCGAPALAFHDDGVAHCNGCHTMHNSQGGDVMAGLGDGAGGYGPGGTVGNGVSDQLLLFANKSDVCLRCHIGYNSYHVWSDQGVLDPGQEHGAGNFVFLEEDNLNDGHGGGDLTDPNDPTSWANPYPGYMGGHTIESGIIGNDAEGVLTAAPGGTFPTSSLACSSCHDPHGNDSYRLTYRTGQVEAGISWNATVDATAIGLFGSFAFEMNDNHPAYRDGYSAWCGSCHGAFHASSGNDIHPSGEDLTGDTIEQYNAYRGTADCIAGPPGPGKAYCGTVLDASTAYLALVPFQDVANVSTSSTAGPGVDSQVACMSCHRSHATSAPDAGRWDFNVTFLGEDGLESGSYALPNPYDPEQRSLCNKCHGKDEFDASGVFP